MDNNRSPQDIQDTLKDLTAEATIQRRALEKIMEQLADYDQPIDYTSQIAGLEKEMARFTERVDALMQLPALANNSEKLLHRIEMTTERSSKEALRTLAKQVREFDSLKNVLLARLKSERHNDGVGLDHHLAPRHRLWTPTTIWPGLTELCFNDFDADSLTKIIHHLNRLAIE